MVIVEFCGPGGCGKTTVCDILEEAIRKQGVCVKNLQKSPKLRKMGEKALHKLTVLSYWLTPSGLHTGATVCLFSCLNHFSQTFHWAGRIIELQYRIRHEQEAEVVILDEGYVQFLSSLAFTNKIGRGLDMVAHMMDRWFYANERNQVILIRCKTDEQTIIERLLTRGRKNDRNVHENQEVMRTLIRQRYENIDRIIDHITPTMVYSCSTDDSEHAASWILRKVSPMWTGATENVEKSK